MKHYVFGKFNDEEGTYNCVTVDAPANTDYDKIAELAVNENEKFRVYEVVTKKWATLYKKYSKLWTQCYLNDLFFDEELYENINGYRITEKALCDCLYVCVDDYNDTRLPIYYLNEVEFSRVVDMLDTLVKSAK